MTIILSIACVILGLLLTYLMIEYGRAMFLLREMYPRGAGRCPYCLQWSMDHEEGDCAYVEFLKRRGKK